MTRSLHVNFAGRTPPSCGRECLTHRPGSNDWGLGPGYFRRAGARSRSTEFGASSLVSQARAGGRRQLIIAASRVIGANRCPLSSSPIRAPTSWAGVCRQDFWRAIATSTRVGTATATITMRAMRVTGNILVCFRRRDQRRILRVRYLMLTFRRFASPNVEESLKAPPELVPLKLVPPRKNELLQRGWSAFHGC